MIDNKWNPYPETKPENDGDYLVTVNSGFIYIYSWSAKDKWLLTEDVIAWMELPSPYESEE